MTNELWVAYRVFVDQRLLIGKTTTTGFHSYAVAHALGVRPHPLGWSGTQAAELFGCLAEAGLLSAFRQGLHRAPSAKAFGVLGAAEAPASALAAYLEQTLAQYHGQFHLAASRKFGRFTAEAEGRWAGPYEFVQLADPQLGMYNDDSSWSEEVTMLKLAISHVNRLRPRFLVVSGDLTNAWPTISNTTELNASNAAVIDAQVASFREALRELDPSIPVVLQPGNHDVGQNPSRASVEAYRARFGDDYCAYWVGGVKYVAINSQYYHTQCESAEAAALRAEQEAWVEDELSGEDRRRRARGAALAHLAVHGRRERGDGLLQLAARRAALAPPGGVAAAPAARPRHHRALRPLPPEPHGVVAVGDRVRHDVVVRRLHQLGAEARAHRADDGVQLQGVRALRRPAQPAGGVRRVQLGVARRPRREGADLAPVVRAGERAEDV